MDDDGPRQSEETVSMETDDDELPVVHLLIASDIHAGFAENKEHISNDSFEALREVLAVGSDSKVDFVLLAGDLFHENHPSRETQLKVVRLLRKYCFREGPPSLDFVSDPTINFQHSNFPVANYLDENLRVNMPIFTIHGNHDDLSGKGLSALDILHEAGLINLFGKFCDVDHIEVTPILLTRGNTKIALYGIGSQRDDRLARSFAKGRVKFNRPEGDDPDSWFSILVLHQNRPPRSKLRSTKSHLSFKNIPLFFDLVVWGHEHECLIDPDFKYMDPNDSAIGFYIMQPGSTVATALSVEEAKKKHIAILSIRGKEFKFNKIPLQTTRQIIVEELKLEEEAQPTAPKIPKSSVRQKKMPDEPLILKRLNEILENAEAARGPRQPWPPRVRLKVIYSGRWLDIPPINGRKWGANHFAERVANASDMVVVRAIHPEKKAKNVNDEQLQNILASRTDDVCSVDEMVSKYYNQCDFKNRLSVLSEITMGKQLQEYSNTELITQYKYTAADKALSDSIRTQIVTLANKVRQSLQERVAMNSTEADDTPLEQQIAEGMAAAKRKRVVRTREEGGDNDPNVSIASSFFERGFEPSRLVTSTPQPSQQGTPTRTRSGEVTEADFDSP